MIGHKKLQRANISRLNWPFPLNRPFNTDMRFPTFIAALALCLVSVVQSAYVPKKLDIFVPRIIKPDAKTTWTAGAVVHVVWYELLS